ncbi:MAG TPA: isochorismate synthase [Acidimicrobiales bacterium]|nr:isochorismate synthase [Acidimicrobiales bacterium]
MSGDLWGLRAVTRRLDDDIDLLAVAGAHGLLFEQRGSGLAARGEAARLEIAGGDERTTSVTAAQEALGAMGGDDDVGLPGTGPVAFGALPFDPSAPGTLVVPSLVVGRADDGTRWCTTVGRDEAEHHAAGARLAEALTEGSGPPAPDAEPSAFSVRPVRNPAAWCASVREATERMATTELHKAVLAREVVIEADVPIDPVTILERLRRAYPGCMISSIDGMVGASPELLVSRTGDVVRSHPMAGTTPRGGDPTADARLAATLLASAKDRHEHQLTIDMVHDTLLPWCSYLDEEAEPSIVAVANVAHLGTRVEGRLSAPAASVLELVGALHPTPAVCGTPRHAALALIATHEALERDRFGGPVGWVDHTGQGAFAVAIRGAEVAGARVRLVAGAGIIADSDPTTELAETQAKLRALLEVLIRP